MEIIVYISFLSYVLVFSFFTPWPNFSFLVVGVLSKIYIIPSFFKKRRKGNDGAGRSEDQGGAWGSEDWSGVGRTKRMEDPGGAKEVKGQGAA